MYVRRRSKLLLILLTILWTTPEAYIGYNATMSLCHYVIVQINLFMRGIVFVIVIVILVEDVYGALGA